MIPASRRSETAFKPGKHGVKILIIRYGMKQMLAIQYERNKRTRNQNTALTKELSAIFCNIKYSSEYIISVTNVMIRTA